jgi:hypothetical protein
MRRDLKVFIQLKGSLAERFSRKIQGSAVSEGRAMTGFGGFKAGSLIDMTLPDGRNLWNAQSVSQP